MMSDHRHPRPLPPQNKLWVGGEVMSFRGTLLRGDLGKWPGAMAGCGGRKGRARRQGSLPPSQVAGPLLSRPFCREGTRRGREQARAWTQQISD